MATAVKVGTMQAQLDAVARRRKRQHREQAIVSWTLRAAAAISIFTTVGIVIILVAQSIGFFAEVSVWDFLTGTEWAPLFSPQKFGVLSLVGGTLLVAVIAGVVSLTLGLGAAIFLSEYAPERLRRILKPILEVLAGIPTVVYGYFALTFVTPIQRV